MPEMDGFEATAAIREREKLTGTHVPIVAMTAHAMKGDRDRCLDAGMDDYVAKPLHVARLMEVIGRLAQTHFPGTENAGLPGESRSATEEPSAAAHAAVLGAPPFDAEAALERVDGDEQLLEEILGLFREQAGALQEEIRGAVSRRDTPALERSAHSLKGSAGNISALEVQSLALRLEELGREGSWVEADRVHAQMEAALPRLNDALDAFTKKLSQGELSQGELSHN